MNDIANDAGNYQFDGLTVEMLGSVKLDLSDGLPSFPGL